MARTVYLFIKRRPNTYRYSMISLVASITIGVIHIIVSRSLRGGSMPVDGVVYMTVLTLLLFLIFKITAVWKLVDFDNKEGEDSINAGGFAAIVTGVLSLTIQFLMESTHTINGVNYGDAFHLTMTGIGTGLLLLGTYILFKNKIGFIPNQTPSSQKSSSLWV